MDKSLKFNNQTGFSLIEVLIAITLFAFFVTAFLTAQGYNVSDSALSEEQLMLQQLCERKINELYLDPPKFQNMAMGLKETKTFEENDLKGFEYTLEIKKLTIVWKQNLLVVDYKYLVFFLQYMLYRILV